MTEPVPNEQSHDRKPSALRAVLVGLLAIVAIIAAVIAITPPVKVRPHRLVCMMNLKSLSVYLADYAEDHNGVYPPAERWCDILAGAFAPEHRDTRKVLRCPQVEEGPCNYAMNPHADQRKAADVVLLFESKPGWNQSGGPELLTTENHRGEGCNVLFTDMHIEFFKTKELGRLKWRYDDVADANRPPDARMPK